MMAGNAFLISMIAAGGQSSALKIMSSLDVQNIVYAHCFLADTQYQLTIEEIRTWA